jgi:hypothetical protein
MKNNGYIPPALAGLNRVEQLGKSGTTYRADCPQCGDGELSLIDEGTAWWSNCSRCGEVPFSPQAGEPTEPKADPQPAEYVPRFRSLTERRKQYPDNQPVRRPECIEGLLRDGETLFTTAGTKLKKSWLFMSLAVCKSYGMNWLGKFPMRAGKVLILDNELTQDELDYRADVVDRATTREKRDCDGLVLESLRGHIPTLHGYGKIIEQAGKEFDLILMDCMYRIRGFNESDPENVKEAFNLFDHWAEMSGSSIAVVHHNSKGEQGHKAITDLGSGTGVLTRAPDTVVAIRPHEQDGFSVLDFVRRSGESPESFTAEFQFPLWQAIDGIAPAVKQPMGRGDMKQNARDEDGKRKILDSIKRGNQSRTSIRKDLGMGLDRMNRLFRELLDDEQVKIIGTDTHPKSHESFDLYDITPKSERSENDDEPF